MPCLEITTMIGCPQRCTYCPQDQLKAQYGQSGPKYLALDDFKTVLAKLPSYVRIDFSGMSEPWANPAATEMLGHALRSGFNVAVYSTLCGMDDYDAVIGWLRDYAHQVEVVRLHLPDKNGNMRGFKPSPEYDAALAAFVAFGQSGAIKTFSAMTMDGAGEVHPGVALGALTLPPWAGNTRAGSLDTAPLAEQPVEATPSHGVPVSCSFTPFYDHNVLLPNGDVVLCCMDYSLKHKLGNLLTGDYGSLFASPEMTALRLANMRRDGNSICKSCSRATRYLIDGAHRQFWQAQEPAPAEG